MLAGSGSACSPWASRRRRPVRDRPFRTLSIRLSGETAFTSRGAAEQQGGLGVTFFVRVENTGDATGSFLVDGDHGGAVFDVRYLAGGTGDDRITERVAAGTYRIEDVPAGRTRTLRIRATVDKGAPIDRTGSWRLEVNTVGSLGSGAALRPIGHLLQNTALRSTRDGHDRTGLHRDGEPPPRDAGDVVLGRRPRAHRAGPRAPVTGKVMRVTRYDLYCEWPDVPVPIRPKDAPERTVQIFHVADPQVSRGDRGTTTRIP